MYQHVLDIWFWHIGVPKTTALQAEEESDGTLGGVDPGFYEVLSNQNEIISSLGERISQLEATIAGFIGMEEEIVQQVTGLINPLSEQVETDRNDYRVLLRNADQQIQRLSEKLERVESTVKLFNTLVARVDRAQAYLDLHGEQNLYMLHKLRVFELLMAETRSHVGMPGPQGVHPEQVAQRIRIAREEMKKHADRASEMDAKLHGLDTAHSG